MEYDRGGSSELALCQANSKRIPHTSSLVKCISVCIVYGCGLAYTTLCVRHSAAECLVLYLLNNRAIEASVCGCVRVVETSRRE